MSDKVKLSFYATPQVAEWINAQNAGITHTLNNLIMDHITNEKQHPPLLEILGRIAAAIESGSLTVTPPTEAEEEEPTENTAALRKLLSMNFE